MFNNDRCVKFGTGRMEYCYLQIGKKKKVQIVLKNLDEHTKNSLRLLIQKKEKRKMERNISGRRKKRNIQQWKKIK